VLVMEFVQDGAVFKLGRSSWGVHAGLCRSGCCEFLGFPSLME
jgi:hypothetical protein